MFVHNLHKDLVRTISMLESSVETCLFDLYKMSIGADADVGSETMARFQGRLLDLARHSLEALKEGQHFCWRGEALPTQLMPSMKISDVPMALTSIDARLPYPVMTVSYSMPREDGDDVPTVAILEEELEGLVFVTMWTKEDGGEVLSWSPRNFMLALSTRGDFRYFDGLREYLGGRYPEFLEGISGYVAPILSLTDEPEHNELDFSYMEMDLIALIIPYLYLLNVKGVPVKDVKPVQAYERRRRGSLPLFSYKTLDIDLPTRTSGGGGSGVVSEEEFQRRLHLCRGHMKQYTKEKPLFGKFSGIIWCPPHFRGNEKAGCVVKRYRNK